MTKSGHRGDAGYDVPVTNDREFGFLAYRDEELSKLDLVGRDGNAHEWTARVLSRMTLP